jgi:hypothetical protein
MGEEKDKRKLRCVLLSELSYDAAHGGIENMEKQSVYINLSSLPLPIYPSTHLPIYP